MCGQKHPSPSYFSTTFGAKTSARSTATKVIVLWLRSRFAQITCSMRWGHTGITLSMLRYTVLCACCCSKCSTSLRSGMNRSRWCKSGSLQRFLSACGCGAHFHPNGLRHFLQQHLGGSRWSTGVCCASGALRKCGECSWSCGRTLHNILSFGSAVTNTGTHKQPGAAFPSSFLKRIWKKVLRNSHTTVVMYFQLILTSRACICCCLFLCYHTLLLHYIFFSIRSLSVGLARSRVVGVLPLRSVSVLRRIIQRDWFYILWRRNIIWLYIHLCTSTRRVASSASSCMFFLRLILLLLLLFLYIYFVLLNHYYYLSLIVWW